MRIAEPQNDQMSPADARWGWTFGCEGLMRISEACRFLSVSRDTIDRRIAAGKLRKGKQDGRVYLCAKSVKEHAKHMEV